MRIVIDSADVELDDATREYIERRLRFALTRYSQHIKTITLYVKSSHQQADRCDTLCKVCIKLIPADGVETEAGDAGIRRAVARAVDMASRAVKWKLEPSPRSLRGLY